MNWNDPTERCRLSLRVGPQEYNRLFQEHVKRSTVATINGYGIRPIVCRFGRIFIVAGTDKGFSTLEQAKTFAAQQEPRT